ncbi:MAG: hypothetical protein M3P18_19390 [Actinomycetota bacterium]|nr:hypothetical protein [Actinomycetota bacterium]
MQTSERLTEVIKSIEALAKEARELISGDEQVVFIPRQGEWSRRMVAWLKPRITHWGGATTLFEMAAARPEEIIAYEDVVLGANMPEIQVRNELAAVSRLTSREFGDKKWPLEVWQDRATGKMQYRMPPIVAEWWRSS